MKRFGLMVALGMAMTLTQPVMAADMTIAEGSTVRIDYTLTVDGQVADTSEGKEPLQYVQGEGQIIPGLESELTGLKVGDERTITVDSADAYGEVNPQAFVEVPTEGLGDQMEPQVGMILRVPLQNGQSVPGVISEIKEDTMVLNLNHPLAGKDLVFDVKVVSIK